MTITCPACGFSRAVAENRLHGTAVIAICPKCACRFRFSAAAGEGEILPPEKSHAPEDGKPEEEDIRQIAADAYRREAERFAHEDMLENQAANPWDSAPAEQGWVLSFFQVTKRVMFSASTFFASLDPFQKLGRAFMFFLIICLVQIFAEKFWMGAMQNAMMSMETSDPQLQKFSEMLAGQDEILLPLLARAALLVIQIYTFSFLMYLVYRLFAGARATYSLVFQIMAYSSAPTLLCVIPVFGSIAGGIWSLAALFLGCKAAMRLTWAQTILGFLPIMFIIAPALMHVLALMQSFA